MPNNDIKNTINPKKKVSYDDIKKIIEDEREAFALLREPNYKIENNNIKNKSKKLLNKKYKQNDLVDYSHFKIN